MAVGIMTGTTMAACEEQTTGPEDRILRAAVLAVQRGDNEAFRVVMEESEKRIAALSWRILGDAEEVKDALQETFLRIYRFIDRYDERREIIPWLLRITVNVCRDLERKRRRRDDRHAALDGVQVATTDPQPDQMSERNEEMALLTRAIEALPQKERLAIILRDIEGFTAKEAARILGNRPSTVRVQVRSARTRIRRFIDEERRGGRP